MTSSAALRYERDGDVAVLTMDDGKANAAGFALLGALGEALQRAQEEARAVALLGRPGVLSGGFDLKVIRGGDPAEIERLVTLGVRVIMQIFGHPQPLVIGAPGHAVALGAFMLLAADYRVGAAGDFKVGLNETAIGLTLPAFGIELARERLSPRHLTSAAIAAQLYTPVEAIEVGFLDEVVGVDSLHQAAVTKAQEMATLDATAYAANKASFRAPIVARVLAGLER